MGSQSQKNKNKKSEHGKSARRGLKSLLLAPTSIIAISIPVIVVVIGVTFMQKVPGHMDHVADGKPLFEFLLQEIPEIVAQVPCSCCPNMLAQCYRGACPYGCEPCNKEGRDVYQWHTEGKSMAEIQSLIRAKYF